MGRQQDCVKEKCLIDFLICNDNDHCDGLDYGGHCNGHDEKEDAEHFHPCHLERVHHHCHSDHSMKSIPPIDGVHFCESDYVHPD